MSVSTIAKRFKRSVLIVVAAAVAIVTVPLAPANAAGNIPVGYDAVEAKSDTYLPTSPCTSLPTQGGFITGLDSSKLPDSYGNCSYISAHYVRKGVDLKLKEIYLDKNNNVVLVPDVPATIQKNQDKVRLSISLDELNDLKKSNGLNSSPIRLHYADTSSFRRIQLSLDAKNSDTSGNNAQPDINMDGTQFTGTRNLFLYRQKLSDGSEAFVRNVSIDVPRLYTINLAETSQTGAIEFKQVNDTSFVQFGKNGQVVTNKDGNIVGRTQKMFDIIYRPASGDAQQVSATITTKKFDTVTMNAQTHSSVLTDGGGLYILDKHGVIVGADPEKPWNNGGGTTQGQFKSGAIQPFFYKVMTSMGETMVNRTKPNGTPAIAQQNVGHRDEIYSRTGIPAHKRTSDPTTWTPNLFDNGRWCNNWSLLSCGRDWANGKNWSGRNDNNEWWHVDVPSDHLLNARIVNPAPMRSEDRWSKYPNEDWITDPDVVDNQDTADSTWPATQVNWEDDQTPVNENFSGKDSKAEFWVEFNGLPSRPIHNDNPIDEWSYFLGRIELNGQWYSVPFPNFPKNVLPAMPMSTGCFAMLKDKDGNDIGKDLDGGNFKSDCTSEYTKARRRMFTPLDKPGVDPEYDYADIPADMFDKDTKGQYVYSVIGLDSQQISTLSPNVSHGIAQVYKPLSLVSWQIDKGPNAGAKVQVELVNARSMGDILADGFSRFTSSGKTVGRSHRHTPDPRVGAATQMTNLSTSDRSMLDWNVDYGKDTKRYRGEVNQWKTLYKVTVTGMMNPNVRLDLHYDYTSKPKLWNAGSNPAAKVEVKEGKYPHYAGNGVNPAWKSTLGWRDRTAQGVENTAQCAAASKAVGWDDQHRGANYRGDKCDAVVADDMPSASETNDGNIRFTLKDGYVEPQLWTYYNRIQSAPCLDPQVADTLNTANKVCTKVDANQQGATRSFRWNYNNEDALGFRETTDTSVHIGTATSTSFQVRADLVKTPFVIMKSSAAGDLKNAEVATETTAAPQSVARDQWNSNGTQLKSRDYSDSDTAQDSLMPWGDKHSNYYLRVDSNIPSSEGGKGFTGYELIGVLKHPLADGTKAEQLHPGQRYYPGDAIDLRDVSSNNTPLVKLSNDQYNDARYSELQLVPTFDTTSRGVPRLYNAAKFLKKSGNLTWQGNDFNFFAAPGLTATANNSPAATLTVDGKDYPYSADDSTLSAVVPAPSGDDSPAEDDDVLKFVYLASADAQVKVNLQYTWLDLDKVDWSGTPQEYPSSMQDLLDENEESIPVTVTVTRNSDGKAVTFTTNPSSSQTAFATAVAGFTSGDEVSLSYSYEVKNGLKCNVQQGDISKNAGSVDGVTVKATPASRLYETNADGKPQEFTSTLFDNLNEFTLNIDAGCHQGVIVYPQGNIPDKYTYTDSQGKHLLPRDTPEHENLWTNEYPMQNSDGSYRYDGTYPDGQPTAWDWFHRKVQYPTLVTPYENLEPDPNGAGEYDSSKSMKYTITSLDDSAESVKLEVRKYTEVPAGRWVFGHSNRPLWKHEINCPGVKTVYNSSGVAIGATVVPGKATVCFLEAKTSEVTILGDMPQYLRDSWIFTLQSDDGSDQDLISGEKVTGKVVTGSDNIHKCFDTCQYYPGKLQVAATNVNKIASSTPKFYMYNQNNEKYNATTADKNIHDDGYWDELVKGEEVETWPAYRRWAADIHPDVLYKVTGDHRVEEEPTGEPKAVEVAGSQHIALKVVITPITNSTLPSAGGMGTTWKIVGIITLIAALFLAIVALLKKRAMQ